MGRRNFELLLKGGGLLRKRLGAEAEKCGKRSHCLVKALACHALTWAPSILSPSSEWLTPRAACPQANIHIWLGFGCGVKSFQLLGLR